MSIFHIIDSLLQSNNLNLRYKKQNTIKEMEENTMILHNLRTSILIFKCNKQKYVQEKYNRGI